jgi:hypothetical protein
VRPAARSRAAMPAVSLLRVLDDAGTKKVFVTETFISLCERNSRFTLCVGRVYESSAANVKRKIVIIYLSDLRVFPNLMRSSVDSQQSELAGSLYP